MNKNQILISHSSDDQEICAGLTTLIERCSLTQIKVWHSSDQRSDGGLNPGDRWLSKLSDALSTSQVVVVLCTANSINSDWVKFEAGFGAASSELEIIPLLVGIEDVTLVPAPFANWQMYKIDTEQRCLGFLKKILPLFGVHYDEKIAKLCFEDFRALVDRARVMPESW
mgnify:CR=1 FL=1